MKKILKVFIIIICLFCVVIADEEEIKIAEDARDEYCNNDNNKKGCVYDSSNDIFQKIYRSELGSSDRKVMDTSATNSSYLTLTKAYQSADSEGNIIFAGCYKGPNGYAFKIVGPDNGGTCRKQADTDAVLFGNSDSSGLSDMGFESWIATEEGTCPAMFALTVNNYFFTRNDSKYIFSDDKNAFTEVRSSYLWHDDYVSNLGCASEDVEGYEEMVECFDEVEAKINSYTCPKDKTYSAITSELEAYQKKCDSKYQTLYSKGLLDRNATDMYEKLKNAIAEKASTCQANECNLSSDQITKIQTNKKGNVCENGCTIANYVEPSTEATAKCYCCGGTSGCTYRWEVKSSNNSSCSLKENIKKTECFGTSKDEECRICLNTAYKNAGLNTTQITCMKNKDMATSLALTDASAEVKEQFNEQVDAKVEENKKTTEQVREAQKTGAVIIDDPEVKISTESKTCDEILGKNLTKIVSFAIDLLRIAGAVIVVVNGMITLVPAVISKDADALKKGQSKCITMGVILALIIIFPSLLRFVGNALGYDISCIL